MEKKIKITTEDILSKECYPQAAIEPLWWSVSIYDSSKQYEEDLAPFTVPQRYVFAIQWYISEVENGGHDQFFYNSTGIVWKDALEGLKAIGHETAVKILQTAVDRMGGNPDLDREKRWEQMEELEPEFEDLDMEFYAIEDLTNRIMEYIQANAGDFVFEGTVPVS